MLLTAGLKEGLFLIYCLLLNAPVTTPHCSPTGEGEGITQAREQVSKPHVSKIAFHSVSFQSTAAMLLPSTLIKNRENWINF